MHFVIIIDFLVIIHYAHVIPIWLMISHLMDFFIISERVHGDQYLNGDIRWIYLQSLLYDDGEAKFRHDGTGVINEHYVTVPHKGVVSVNKIISKCKLLYIFSIINTMKSLT